MFNKYTGSHFHSAIKNHCSKVKKFGYNECLLTSSVLHLFTIIFYYSLQVEPVADPGFPRGGGANPKGGAPTYYLANFSRKLHENEEILGQRGGHVPRAPP